jgi:putative transposase
MRKNSIMKKLPRYNEEDECHFANSVTRERRQIFGDSTNMEILINTIKFYRERGDIHLLGYVVMPDHVHLMMIPRRGTISDIMRNIKAYTGNTIRQRMRIHSDIWQDSFHDHVVRGNRDFEAKLDYMHSNPLRDGIVDDLASYPYSSYRNFYTDHEPVLETDME